MDGGEGEKAVPPPDLQMPTPPPSSGAPPVGHAMAEDTLGMRSHLLVDVIRNAIDEATAAGLAPLRSEQAALLGDMHKEQSLLLARVDAMWQLLCRVDSKISSAECQHASANPTESKNIDGEERTHLELDQELHIKLAPHGAESAAALNAQSQLPPCAFSAPVEAAPALRKKTRAKTLNAPRRDMTFSELEAESVAFPAHLQMPSRKPDRLGSKDPAYFLNDRFSGLLSSLRNNTASQSTLVEASEQKSSGNPIYKSSASSEESAKGDLERDKRPPMPGTVTSAAEVGAQPCGLRVGDALQVLPDICFSHDGEEYYSEGDVGYVKCFVQNDEGSQVMEIKWERTGKVNRTGVDTWFQRFALFSESEASEDHAKSEDESQDEISQKWQSQREDLAQSLRLSLTAHKNPDDSSSSIESPISEASRKSGGSENVQEERVATVASLETGACKRYSQTLQGLDAMHTDQLLASCGINKATAKTGRNSSNSGGDSAKDGDKPAVRERRGSNASIISGFMNSVMSSSPENGRPLTKKQPSIDKKVQPRIDGSTDPRRRPSNFSESSGRLSGHSGSSGQRSPVKVPSIPSLPDFSKKSHEWKKFEQQSSGGGTNSARASSAFGEAGSAKSLGYGAIESASSQRYASMASDFSNQIAKDDQLKNSAGTEKTLSSSSFGSNRRWSSDMGGPSGRRSSLSKLVRGSAKEASPRPTTSLSARYSGASPCRTSILSHASRDVARQNSFTHGSVTGMDALRIQHELMLVSNVHSMKAQSFTPLQSCKDVGTAEELEDWSSSDADMSAHNLVPTLYRMPQAVLNIYGIVQLDGGFWSLCFANCVFVVLLGLFAHSICLAFLELQALYVHLSTAFYTFGGLCGVLSLRLKEIDTVLGPTNRPLDSYARNYGFVREWHAVSMWRFFACGALFMTMVLSRIAAFSSGGCPGALGGMSNPDGEPTSTDVQSLVAFILISGLIAAITYCHLHVCCWMELSVDKFCFRFFQDKDITSGIGEWNILQAILRRAADKLDSCFLAAGTSVLLQVLLTGMELMQGDTGALNQADVPAHCQLLWCGWIMPPVLMLLMVFFRAAAVTEKCSRVPALVNSWTFAEDDGNQIDHGRQYVVQYIMHSGAGFYVKGVRLSAFMAIKMSYLIGVVTFTIVTQSVLRSS